MAGRNMEKVIRDIIMAPIGIVVVCHLRLRIRYCFQLFYNPSKPHPSYTYYHFGSIGCIIENLDKSHLHFEKDHMDS